MGLTKPRATQIYDIDYKQATRVITLTNITLSGGAPSTVDGVGLSVGDRVLVTGQSTASQNGIYYVTTLGSGSNGTWARTSDTNETGELEAGTIVMVTEGTIYHDTQWKLTTNNPIVIGTSELTFEQNSAFAFGNVYANSTAVLATTVGDVLTLTAGNNISITGNASAKSVKVDVTQVVSVTGNVIGGNINTGGLVSATGNIIGGNITTVGLITATGNVTGANLVTAGNITAIGNIHCDPGHYFIGNGSQLTGISGGGGGGSSISNGGSNIGVAFNGNATVGIASILTATFGPDYFTLSGTNTPGFYSQVKNSAITSNVTLPASRSIMSIAPFVVNNGAVVTIPDSSTLTVLT